jgi:GSH-dependent disulfide-bond oxidoreductase
MVAFCRRRRARAETLQWLMVALTAAGPFTGQAHHWTALANDRPDAAVRHHVGLVARVYRALDQRLGASRYLADDYSIADIALYPWIARHDWAAQSLDDTPSLKRWYQDIGARPAVMRGMRVPEGAKLE